MYPLMYCFLKLSTDINKTNMYFILISFEIFTTAINTESIIIKLFLCKVVKEKAVKSISIHIHTNTHMYVYKMQTYIYKHIYINVIPFYITKYLQKLHVLQLCKLWAQPWPGLHTLDKNNFRLHFTFFFFLYTAT